MTMDTKTTTSTIRVLLIEDNPADVRMLQETLNESILPCFEIVAVDTLSVAGNMTANDSFDIVLLDLALPGTNGTETLKQYLSNKPECPVIVMTSMDDERLAMHALQFGAQDYLVKGQSDMRHLVRTMLYAIERNNLLKSLKEAHKRERYLATHDAVTGLPNRLLFHDRLANSLSYARRYHQFNAVMFIDLDRFKGINDTLGHDAGDTLLRQVSERLQVCVRESDTLARMGGDEFAVLLLNISRPEDAAKVAQDIITSLGMPFTYGNREMFIGASVGIAIYPNDSTDGDTLIKHADSAMYQAKTTGGNRHSFYTEDLTVSASQRLSLESALRQALHNHELRLHYQPKFDAVSRKIVAAEALVRWQHVEHGLIEPADFLPIAEESGLVVQLDEWVLHETCRQNKAWQDAGLPPLTIAVNLSLRHFAQRNLVAKIQDILTETGLEGRFLELELTEAIVMSNNPSVLESLRALHTLGVQLSIDDFGRGYSSLARLNSFPIDTVKIDGCFIQSLQEDPDAAAITSAIIALAHGLHLHVIAEGVENEHQAEFLHKRHCDGLQGFLLGKPMTADAFIERLKSGS